MKKRKPNPFCPIPGCGTKDPHKDDPIVKDLLRVSRGDLATWALAGMVELGNSILREIAENQFFAWLTRLRQPEELYVRTLYLLLLANDDEAAHVLSDAMPNGFTALYKEVNEKILGNRGVLTAKRTGSYSGEFTGMDAINYGAHLSVRVMLTTIGIHTNPAFLPGAKGYRKHIDILCGNLGTC